MAWGSLFAVFQFSFMVSFGAVVSPGPVSAAIVSESARNGWRVGPLIATGHTFLELVIVLLISFGLSFGMAAPGLRFIIAIAGGVVLIWIGGSYLVGVWKGRIHLPEPTDSASLRSPLAFVLLGMATTLSNPFWYTWWVTVAAGYLAQAQAVSAGAIAAFYLGHISADFIWDSTLAAATSTGRRWLSDRGYRVLIVMTGGFMLYLGFLFLYSALSGSLGVA